MSLLIPLCTRYVTSESVILENCYKHYYVYVQCITILTQIRPNISCVRRERERAARAAETAEQTERRLSKRRIQGRTRRTARAASETPEQREARLWQMVATYTWMNPFCTCALVTPRLEAYCMNARPAPRYGASNERFAAPFLNPGPAIYR